MIKNNIIKGLDGSELDIEKEIKDLNSYKQNSQWNVEYKKQATEIFVANNKKEIYIGGCDTSVNRDLRKQNMKIAIIICDALNKAESV